MSTESSRSARPLHLILAIGTISRMGNAGSPDVIKSNCNRCCLETNQTVLFEHLERGQEDIEELILDWRDHFFVLKCMGCDTVSFKIDEYRSHGLHPDELPPANEKHYPPKLFRREPIWLMDGKLLLGCPFEIQRLLRELYVCLGNNCLSAAAMTSRAVLEYVMVTTSGDHGTFAANTGEFFNAGHISNDQKVFIDAVLDAGGATIHRLFAPSHQDMSTILDIVEGVIHSLYVQKKQIEDLKKRVPPRDKRKSGA